MKLLTAKSRIAIGLACLLASVLSTAMMLGIVPAPGVESRAGRADLCESIAITSSDYISRGELLRLESMLELIVERNQDILSAGIRRPDNTLVAAIGKHTKLWQADPTQRSTDTHVQVPIRSGQEKWGSVEIRFQPIQQSGLAGWLNSPWLRMSAFVTAASYLLFLVYLGKMLSHLDPSQSVPKRVRTALDALAEGLLVIDRNGRIVLANQSFASWVGHDPEKIIGKQAESLAWVKNEQGQPLEVYPWQQAIELETAQAGIMLGLASKNKATQLLIANASPVLGHDGKYRGVLVSFDDVTQLEETKRDLQQAKQVADHANQAKSDFLARMSHEIRTPMNAILGYTDVLRRGFDENTNDRREYLDTIHSSGEHLLALINDILDLSKIEAGRMELDLARCSPHKLIQQVASVLRVKAKEKDIALEVRFETPLPESILTDSVRLHQTLMNLVGNAVKFTSHGSVIIAARLAETSYSGQPQLVVEVIDTGIGMPQSVQRKIFEPFSQADSSVTRKFGGTGLGLAISRQLAEALGGGIAIESEEGQGSTFTVTVNVGPLAGVQLVDAQTAAAVASLETTATSEIIQLPPARILAADDGASNRKLIELVLGRAGVNVVSVENGQLAVERAFADSFDCILLDMQMPVMDGYTAAKRLREAGYSRPIIAMTAHAMQGDEEKCRAAGCDGFLTKPIKIDLLLTTLHSALSDREDALPTAAHSAMALTENPTPCNNTPDPVGHLSALEEHLQKYAISETNQETQAERLTCSLPLEDPDFYEIAAEFLSRFQQQLEAMKQASTSGRYGQLAELAHWLKGSGGTAGYDFFTMPASALEQAARAEQQTECAMLLDTLTDMVRRIELMPNMCQAPEKDSVEPSGQQQASPRLAPLYSSLPTEDPDFREIVEEFAVRLQAQITAMEQASLRPDYQELASLAHWLKGSGGTAGFDVFTSPAKMLERLIEQGNYAPIPTILQQLRQLADRIAIAEPTATSLP